jgi:hypothetical protein
VNATPGNAAAALAELRIPVQFTSERPASCTPGLAAAVASDWWRLRRQGTAILYVTDYVTWRSSTLTAAPWLACHPSCTYEALRRRWARSRAAARHNHRRQLPQQLAIDHLLVPQSTDVLAQGVHSFSSRSRSLTGR